MACPYFYPLARFESSPWSVPPRLPLGDAFSGECRASETPAQPDETRMRELCNVGYGRGRCEHFPSESSADAIRFHAAGFTGELIKIQYFFEKDCWPAGHGEVDFGAAPSLLRRQAEAFHESYLRRQSEI